MEWAIAQVDPKKMIKTGSFRINPDGSQSTRDVKLIFFLPLGCICVLLFSAVMSLFQVPFARSEGHLLELMEKVCERMNDYGETADSATTRKTYMRFMAREGTKSDMSNVSYDSRVTADLKFAVRDFLLGEVSFCWRSEDFSSCSLLNKTGLH